MPGLWPTASLANYNVQYWRKPTCAVPRCGRFAFTRTAKRKLEGLEAQGDGGWKAKLSYWIRDQQGEYPEINYNRLVSIIEDIKLPTIEEQANNLIAWLGKQLRSPSDVISDDPVVFAAIVGCENGHGVDYVAKHLAQKNILDYNYETELGRQDPYLVKFGLTFEGWQKYREIIREKNSTTRSGYSVFLSYAREDKEAVENLHARLEGEGFSPWMDTKNLVAGEDWKLALARAIRESTFFVACLSKNFAGKRGMIQQELKEALDLWKQKLPEDIYLIPVRLEDCGTHESLGRFQWVDLFEEDGFEKLLRAINEGVKRLEN